MKKTVFNISKVILLLIIVAITAVSCGDDNNKTNIDPDFMGYISAFTSGVVSKQASIQIRLTEPYKNAIANKKIEEELFDFSPNIDGEAYWVDDRTIEFRPNKKLASGKLFEAEFYLSKLMKVPDKLETLVFQFQVMKQDFDLEFGGMESHSLTDLKLQMIHGSVLTYDYAENENIEKSFTALQEGNKLQIVWEHIDGKIHNFTINKIKRKEEQEQVILQWNGDLLGLDKKGEKVFEIPPLGEFSVLDVKITQQPEQIITIYFSDPIKQNQDIEGLILIKPDIEFRIVKEVNSINLYPTTRLKGTKKLIVTNSIKNVMNYDLMANYEQDITFTNIKPAVELIGKGNILPSSNGLVFPFKAVNLKAVNVKILQVFENNIAQFFQVNQFDGKRELKRVARIVYKGEVELKSENPIDYGSWNNFSLDLSKYMSAEPGAIYRVMISFTKQQSLYPCDDDGDEEIGFSQNNDDDESFDGPSGDWYYYEDDDYYYYNDYNYEDRENPCKATYYMANRSVSRNILASDLGIIAKSGHSNIMTVAITDLKTTEPISGVSVEMYNFQHQLIGTQETDADGFVQIDLKKKPFLLIAKKDKQRGYLRLDDGTALSLSMFDIGGQQVKKGIKGYIYGERGVWRPGDSLFISFILEDKNKVLPENHPVVLELYTPENQLYERKVSTKSVNNFYDFRTATKADAPTGNWLAKVKIGGSAFTKTIKIETIKPNRLKINLDFHKKFLSNIGANNGDLEVKWLHGAIAGNLKVDIELKMTKAKTAFDKYAGYSFDDASKTFYSEDEIVFAGKLDDKGKLVVNPKIKVSNNAPGMLKANFKLRAFERGGDFSVDRSSILYSPYRGYVGLKIPKGNAWNGALYSNEPNIIPIVTVDEKGNPVDRKDLVIEVFDVYWRWWWEHSEEDNLANYVSNRNKNLIKTAKISTVNGKARYELNLDGKYYGRKYIRITDPVTGHSAGQTFYVTYKSWWNNDGSENPGGAEMLTFSTDKKKYNVGEKIKVNIPTAKQGRSLVSIESGSKIIKTFWKNMSDGENSFEIEATEEMAPNIYINITLIQPYNNVKNDLPIRLYGVQSVRIENPNSHLEPIISMPKVLAPEKNFTVKVSEKTGKKMTYTLAVVDDGLLDLTRFKTPDPWSHFYAKEALSVHTWDMYKYVIGAFSGEMAGLLALGGDEYINKDGGAKANRFKPVVKFLGPFTIEANQKKTHTIKMPNYVGSVRTMIVAGNNGAYGSAEKTTPVKTPLMVLATLPRVVGPGEKVELPVSVFAMDKNIKDVTVTVKTNKLLHLTQNTKTIHFSREGDKLVNFSIDVAKKLGIGKVKVMVASGSKKAYYDIELDVRASNPRVRNTVSVMVEPGKTWEKTYNPVGMLGTNKAVLEVSAFPALKLQNRLQYLISYPHGCVEQTTSSVFPQLFLNNLIKLSKNQKIDIDENIKSAINKLHNFQIYSGGFSYWQGERDMASEWSTNYVGHFLLEAKAKGYTIPQGILSKWKKFQKQRANSWSSDNDRYHYYSSNQLVQAYRLYTLALAKSPAMGAMNRLRTTKKLSPAAKWRLAAAYFLAGKKNIAENMVANLSTDINQYIELSYTFGSSLRDKAMILETLTMLDKKKQAKQILDEIAKQMSSNNWYSTQTTAYCLLAAAKFAGVSGAAETKMSFEYSVNSSSISKLSSQLPIYQCNLGMKGAKQGNIVFKNTSNKTLFVELQLEGIPLVGDKTNAENNLKMQVRYLSLDGKVINPEKLDQGTDFIAEVTVTHLGIRANYKELALTQIFPSGWEIRNMRMDEAFNDDKNNVNKPRYQDIRDDRVLSYFDLAKYKTKTFRVLLNASYLGEFYLPSVYCEAMYDHNINAQKAGKWVKVVIPGE